MSITEQIKEIIKPYLFQEEDGEQSIYDSQVLIDIEELLMVRKVPYKITQKGPYKINEILCNHNVNYKQQYYIYSWLEDNELHTYELLLKILYRNIY